MFLTAFGTNALDLFFVIKVIIVGVAVIIMIS